MSKQPRICLIDDDIFVRDALAIGLADAGFDVLSAPGAAAGFDIARREQIDALVTDMNMPGTGGAELVAQVRAEWPHLPIVIMSGATEIDGVSVKEIAQTRGANAAITKPFRAKQLADLLNGLLGNA